MHVMDHVQRIHIQPAHPCHIFVIGLAHLIIIEHAVESFSVGTELYAALFVFAAVERKKEKFGKVAARAEELHLFSDLHRGDTAGNAVIVPVDRTHQVIILVLNGIRIDGDLRAELLKGFRELFRPKDGQIGFGSSAKIVQRL